MKDGVAKGFVDLIRNRPAGGFGVILGDCPWQFETYSDTRQTKAVPYDVQSLADLQAMPVEALAARNSALFAWALPEMLPQALDTIKTWGFEFKTCAPWAKQSSTGKKWAFGKGYIMRNAAELLIVATRGKPRVQSHAIRNLIVAPVRENSRKPDEIYAICEKLYAGPYCEIFARQRRPGWTSWGNQVDLFNSEIQGGTDAQSPA